MSRLLRVGTLTVVLSEVEAIEEVGCADWEAKGDQTPQTYVYLKSGQKAWTMGHHSAEISGHLKALLL